MAVGAGKSFLLQIGDGGGSEVFTTIGGLRSKSLSIAAEGIEKTNHGSSQWKELIEGAGIRSMSVSGSGVFTDSATESQMLTDMLAQTLRNFKLIDEETGDYFLGKFKITSMELASEYNAEKNWSISLESSGEITFTAA